MKPREESTAAQDRDRQRQRAADLAGNRMKMSSITSSGRSCCNCWHAGGGVSSLVFLLGGARRCAPRCSPN
uniref:Uncharacterized protein n=1 Tax=Setaria viridis TaxID=4556 RepID=A0A4V6DAF4_SETVI|nr:hypothetical protein SEVIR_3G407450v2 [Setaria viridis]